MDIKMKTKNIASQLIGKRKREEVVFRNQEADKYSFGTQVSALQNT